ncbi:AraC family transcriptional regulator [Agarilytica rhodophyticola]|uniref:AraC family transcriptional regulator n=1 Tax=Agarilytica rhodophyticola TaxID=1737490 RepID=UPI000B3494ED|nr:AraC family transcriptional regulator [Agarilytica rhodophyticola]
MSIDKKCIAPFMFNLVVRVFDNKGLDTEGLVHELDLHLSDLANQDTRISYSDALKIIDNAYAISQDHSLGITIAQELNISDWGMMGYAVISCDNLWDSLIVGQRYNRAATRLTNNIVNQGASEFSLQSMPLYKACGKERFLIEEDLGGVVGMLRRYLGDNISPKEVHFSYPAPEYIQRYHAHFRCPIKFEQTYNRIIWPISDLKRPLPLRNPAATKMAIQHCEKLIAEDEEPGGIAEQVRAQLAQTPGEYPSIKEISSHFNMSESSLRRALKTFNTSYQEILNNVRKKLAIEYLSTSNLKLEDIALLLGYSDLSNFRRAFRSWTGKAPVEYRAKK